MPGRGKTKRIKTASEIKQEEEEEEGEEWQGCETPKRRNTEETTTARDNAAERGEKGGESGGKRTRKGPMEKRRIKTEPDEVWPDSDEPSDADYSDPDYDSDDGRYFSDDGDDLCKRRNDNVNTNSELSWEFRSAEDSPPNPLRFRPASIRLRVSYSPDFSLDIDRGALSSGRGLDSRPPGPTLPSSSSWTPLSVFQLFCSPSVIRKIVENTNKNGVRVYKRWKGPITVNDFYMFLITVLFTSLVKLHDRFDYWKKCWPYDFQCPADSCSSTLFERIRIALSVCDPDEDNENEKKKGTPEYDKLFKIKPFYTELVNACKAHFQPHGNICVHERKARKNKPLKCGYRVFALADSLTGYTWNFYIDTGKSAATRGQTAGYRAVKNLLPVSVIGSGYTLYTDGLFSSPRLFTELLNQNIGCCGILSKNHSEFPKAAQNDFPAPQASRGDIRWLRKDKLLFVKWMDTREVAMCSTVHEAFTGQVIKRPVRQGKGWVPKQFSCPDAVADFNRHMVVPGNSNFDFSYCIPSTRVRFPHRILFYHCLDLAVVNSFILYKEVMKLKGDEAAKYLTQKEFREKLCKEMYRFAKGCDPGNARHSAPKPTPGNLCMPVYYVEGNSTVGRKTCKICRKKTPIYCQKCLVALCLTSCNNCFKQWHELEECG